MTEYNRPLLASNFYSSNGIDFSCPYKSIIGQSEIELSKKKEINAKINQQIAEEVDKMFKEGIPQKRTKAYFQHITKQLANINSLIDTFQ